MDLIKFYGFMTLVAVGIVFITFWTSYCWMKGTGIGNT